MQQKYRDYGKDVATRELCTPPSGAVDDSQEIRGQLGYLEKELEIATDYFKTLCQRLVPLLDSRPEREAQGVTSVPPHARQVFSEIGVFIVGLRDKVKSLTLAIEDVVIHIRI